MRAYARMCMLPVCFGVCVTVITSYVLAGFKISGRQSPVATNFDALASKGSRLTGHSGE